jgi:acetylornithine deacetylase/succinyl-diaminopimelate desuccinylase-like protein
MVRWVKGQSVSGLTLEVMRGNDNDGKKSPLIFITIDATDNKTDDTILFYGHLDKQPVS